MNATERCTAIIHHEEPDRLPIYLMGFPPYSKVFKEFRAKENELFDSDYGGNDDNILLTPLGDFTMRYFFGGEVEMCGVGMIYGVYNHALNEDGTISDDPLFPITVIPVKKPIILTILVLRRN